MVRVRVSVLGEGEGEMYVYMCVSACVHECIYIDAYASLDMDGCVCIGAYMHGLE